MTDEDFQDALNEMPGPVLVEFTAEWSGASHINAPVLREIARRYRNKMRFYRIHVDEHKDLADAYGIHHIPTILIFQKGQLAVHMTGPVPREELVEKIEALFK